MQTIETQVLVVGTGPAGSAAALFLSTYGVETLVVTKETWTAQTPRSHITNQRTMEILRDMDIEQDALAQATPQHLMANNIWAVSVAGEELGRMYAWGNHPRRKADYALASPSSICDLPQNLLEPTLLTAAMRRGAQVRFQSEFLRFEQDDHGVTAWVYDRPSGSEYAIRAKYLIGADGGRSRVVEQLGLPLEGEHGIGVAINVTFNADLSRYVAHRPGVLFWIVQPGFDQWSGGGTVRMVRPWDEWLAIFGHDPSQGEPDLSHTAVAAHVRRLIGDETIPLIIHEVSKWRINRVYATRYSQGRVFCVGDAVHRHPPTNGLGSNTSIQDSYNLAWKIKLVLDGVADPSLVLDGVADPSLLATYDAERVPVGTQIVNRAIKSLIEHEPIGAALGVIPGQSAAERLDNIARRTTATPEGKAQRQALQAAIALKNYEFNCHGVELNQRYRSQAVVGDGAPEPPFERDAELYYQPTTWPGARLPHCWLEHQGRTVSTLDLVGKGRFTLLTGMGGEGWQAAADAVGAALGIELACIAIGPGQAALDLYGDWAQMREIDEDGCMLVRPDGHVAWRQHTLATDPPDALQRVMRQLLGIDRVTPEVSARAEPVAV